MMNIGVSSYSFSRYRQITGASLLDVCRKAKEIGFDAIEFINLDGEDHIAQAKELRALCAELGLTISAYTVGANMMDDDIEAVVSELMHCVDVTEALGAKIMRHDVCYSMPEEIDWETAIKKMAPHIRRVTEYAKSKGIRTCIENHGFIFQDSCRVKKLIDEVGDENYRWLIDLGNFLCTDESPLSAVRTAAPYAIHVHAKDFIFRPASTLDPEGFICTRGGNFIRGTVLGHGVVPLYDCVKLLKDSGYDGTLSLEFEGLEDNIPALEMGYRTLRRLAAL
jgi:sugar phosphate isomerase/epimerase